MPALNVIVKDLVVRSMRRKESLMYQVINQDCLEAIINTEEGVYDLVLADPPYFDYKTGHRKDKAGKLSQSLVQQSRQDQIRVIQECVRVLKMDRAFFVFTNWEQDWWMQEALGSLLRNKIIWNKMNWSAGDLKGSFGNQYEVILLGCKGKWEYKGGREHDIWDIPRVGTNRIHSTEKPVALYKKIIENSCDEGALILDPYGGSGASVIAALELNRNIVTYEIDETYYQGIIRRVKEYESKHTITS